ncbi:helix-turn-helix domain-containing protein [Streptomyces sp. NPDC054933]
MSGERIVEDRRQTPMERMRALDHLSPRDAAKAWGVPPQGLRNAAEQISQIRSGSHRSLAKDRPGCPEPVTSFYGFPCKYPVEKGMDICAMHRRAKAHPDTDSTSYALAAVQMHEGWEELRAQIWNLDKRALQSERLRLFRALETRATLSEEDYRLAALLLPSDDPATQERRALGLPGPNDGIGDGARLRGLGVLLAAAESAALGLNGGLPAQAGAAGSPVEREKKSGPMLYSVVEAAERLGVGASWLRTESSAGRVPHRMIGSRRMFSEEDLEQIVKDAYQHPSTGRTAHPQILASRPSRRSRR